MSFVKTVNVGGEGFVIKICRCPRNMSSQDVSGDPNWDLAGSSSKRSHHALPVISDSFKNTAHIDSYESGTKFSVN